jgi:DNA-binding MarR family transcriptional regulator
MRQTELVARDSRITPQWYLLLLQIKGAPDLGERATVTELADRLQLAQSSVTELVARVEHAGLVRREPSSEDGRVVHLRLTKAGEASFAQVFRSLAAERQALRDAIATLDD